MYHSALTVTTTFICAGVDLKMIKKSIFSHQGSKCYNASK